MRLLSPVELVGLVSRIGIRSGLAPLLMATLLFLMSLPEGLMAQGGTDGLARFADTSSPRATLQTLRESIDDFIALSLEETLSYAESERLYRNDAERRLSAMADRQFARGIRTLDVSSLPSGFRRALATESMVRLADVLARVELPELAEVPDEASMKAAGETRWSIPGIRIEIAEISEGQRTGEYLISAATVAALEQLHSEIIDLPPRSGSVKRYLDGLRAYTSETTLYGLWQNNAASLRVLPPRWLYDIPGWLKVEFLGASTWQWMVTLVLALAGVSLLRSIWGLGGRFGVLPRWRRLVMAVLLLLYSLIATPLLEILQIGGVMLCVGGAIAVVTLYLASTWTAFAAAGAIAEIVIERQNLRVGGVDSQLVRLGARLAALALATMLFVQGAEELGLPAYSLITGLGVSGLAFALAARDTLANLLGSVTIMFEKPFRSHDWIRIGEAEGTVEQVGFRSTRIRTFEDSLISIPNSLVINAMVDNLGVRGRRRQRFYVEIPYGVSLEKIGQFVDGTRAIISGHPATHAKEVHIHLNEFRASGMAVLVYFYLREPDYETELSDRGEILRDMLNLAETLSIELGLPR